MGTRGGYRENAILFNSPWRHREGGTKTIRVPVVFADLLLAIAKGIDSLESLNAIDIAKTVISLVREKIGKQDLEDDYEYDEYVRQAIEAEKEHYTESITEFLEDRTFDEIKKIQLLKIVKQLRQDHEFEPDVIRALNLPWTKCSDIIMDVLEASPEEERPTVVEGLIILIRQSYWHSIGGTNRFESNSIFDLSEAFIYLLIQRQFGQPVYTRQAFHRWQKTGEFEGKYERDDAHDDESTSLEKENKNDQE